MSIRLSLVCLITLILTSTFNKPIFSQHATNSPHIFQMMISGCANQPDERSQTGFRVKHKEVVGIVTALHGVVDCTDIVAVGIKDLEYRDLEIVKVDVARDVALLWSKKLGEEILDGLEIENDTNFTIGEELLVVGYPINLDTQLATRNVTLRGTTTLLDLIPGASIKDLATRRSPDIYIRVLSIEGHLLPGHSGAPVFNKKDRLIGVANGGLKGGTVEIGWAVPWNDIDWQAVSSTASEVISDEAVQQLEKLKSLTVLPFTFSSSENYIEDTLAQIKTIVEEGSAGTRLREEAKRVQEFEKLRHSYMLGFRFTLAIIGQAYSISSSGSNADQMIDKLLIDANSDAEYLGIRQEIKLPPPNPGEEKIKYAVRAINTVMQDQSYGQAISKLELAPKTAFDLAAEVGVAPLYFSQLAQADQQDYLDKFKRNLRILGISESALASLEQDLKSTDEKVSMLAVVDFMETVLDTFHERIVDTVWLKQRELDVWLYSSNAAFIAVLYDAGKLETNDLPDVTAETAKAQDAGKRLGLTVPELPSKTDDNIQDTAIILHYLLNTLPTENGEKIRERFGRDALAIQELAVKLHILLIVYTPDDEIQLNSAAVSAITRASRAFELPDDLWMPLIRKIERGEDKETVVGEILEFRHVFSEHLQWRIDSAGNDSLTPTPTVRLPTVETTKSAEATSELAGLGDVKTNTKTLTQTPEPPTFTSISTSLPTATASPTRTPTFMPPSTQTPRPTTTPIPRHPASSFSLWRYFPFNTGSYWVYEVQSNNGGTWNSKETVRKTSKGTDGVVRTELLVKSSTVSSLVSEGDVELYEWNTDSISLRSVVDAGPYWAGLDVGITYKGSKLIAQEPMKLGQTWSWNGKVEINHPLSDRTEDGELSATVLGLEDITVRAQTFNNALHVQIIRTYHQIEPLSHVPTIREDRWLVDGVGTVKLIISDTSDDRWLATYELVEYQITP